MSNQHKNPTISFRISEAERKQIEARILASGMMKKDYFVRSCIYFNFIYRSFYHLHKRALFYKSHPTHSHKSDSKQATVLVRNHYLVFLLLFV